MSRQNIKYLMCLVYNSIGAFSIYLLVMNIIHYKNFGQLWISISLYVSYIVSALILRVTHLNDSYGYSKDTRRSTFIYPKLPKKIIHESGNYYVQYNKKDKYYDIYIDNYFNLRTEFRIEDTLIFKSDDLLKEIKEKLDDKYRTKVDRLNRLREKENALKEWDGYTSVREKRDDKIKQITS